MTPNVEHLVDEVVAEDGTTEAYYNYLVYRWEAPAITARAYLDEIGVVSILGGNPTPSILAYLRARYPKLQRLGRDGYHVLEDGA